MTLLGDSGTAESPWPGLGELRWALRSDIGLQRAVNEDSAIAMAEVFAVADGMGGHAAGDRASAAAVDALAGLAVASEGDEDAVDGAEARVLAALTAASAQIERISEELEADAGTTATGMVPIGGQQPEWLVFNVGDSRVYRLRDGELEQVTIDHSLVQLLVDEGVITPEQAEHHPDGNVVTRALGFGEPPAPDFFRVPARAGDRLLLCSDGLTKEVGPARLRELLAADSGVDFVADGLVTAALDAGGRDNVTVLVLEISS